MTVTYQALCWIAAAACLAAAAIGGLVFRSGFAHPRAWLAIRIAQGSIVAAAALGAVLLAGLGEPGYGLAYGYSLMAAGVSFAAEQLRLASATSVLARVGIHDSDGVAGLPEKEQERLATLISLRELGVEATALAVCTVLLLRGAGAF